MSRKPRSANEKLASALSAAKALSGGGSVFSSSKLSRVHLKTLFADGWVKEMYAGWYAISRPSERDGESVSYYANYWEFLAKYLLNRLGADYTLDPVSSLEVHADNRTIPSTITVQTSRTTRAIVNLKHGLSLLIYNTADFDPDYVVEKGGLRIQTVEKALSKMPVSAFRTPSPALLAALSSVRNVPELSRLLLTDRNQAGAGRIASALRLAGRVHEADLIVKDFAAGGFVVKEHGNLDEGLFGGSSAGPEQSPLVSRLIAAARMFGLQAAEMKIPPPIFDFRSQPFNTTKTKIQEIYVHDAYNSLSIEGYQVSEDLIEKISYGEWDPDTKEADGKDRDAMAAKGYFDAFGSVLLSLEKIHGGDDVIETLKIDFMDWRRQLFGQSVRAGILPASALAGYRNEQVYIRGSTHVPPDKDRLMDAMDALFLCLKTEKNLWVRALLGHFLFVFIHPFPDGNGRIGRFLMNALLVSGGYPWTVIRVSERAKYMAALEKASVGNDFRDFISLMQAETRHGGKTSARTD
jgi:hypothetical protein